MHRLSTSFVLGYHGCDVAVAEKLLKGAEFRESANDYDWLGPGVYFWEANPQRGLDFAIEASARASSSITTPAVVGAVIDLGLCLDLTTMGAIEMVKAAHDSFVETFETATSKLSAKKSIFPNNSNDMLRRKLDCAVIQRLHTILDQDDIKLDSLRGIFVEGKPIYDSAGFYEKTHIQIAVRNPQCIKATFFVPEDQLRRWSPGKI